MNRRFALVLVVALATALVACTAGSGGLGPVPTPLASPDASSDGSSPSPLMPSPTPSTEPSPPPSGTPSASPAASPSPAGTTTVRAYFILADGPTGGGGLVPVLFEVPATKAVARAAMTALLEGPGHLRDASQVVSTAIPPATQLLGITVADGVAIVDLSGEFETGGGSASVFGRLGQVVYTLTQFPTVSSVRFRVDGRDVTLFSSEGIIIDHPLTRSDFEDQLPAMFVDRPAWGANIGNPARITGTANVFEAQFRVSIIAGDGTVVADAPVVASCGTGCRGTFDVTVPYRVSRAGWGTLRVYDPSEKDGSPQDIREYPVYLQRAP